MIVLARLWRRVRTADPADSGASNGKEVVMDNTRIILDLLRSYLDEDGMEYRVREGCPVLEGGYRGDNAPFVIRISINDAPLSVLVTVTMPVVIAEDQRVAMADAVARANFGLLFGCFDLDMSDGTLGFRNSMPVCDGTVTHEQFRRLVGPAMGTADRYLRAFNRLIYGDDLSPAEAIAEVEMSE
jgi:hypothetical protein